MVNTTLYKKYPKEKIEEAIAILTYKHADALPKHESTTKPIIYIFRHGQSEDNADFIFSGWRDSKLTKLGKEQAQVLAEKLKDKKIDLLISSPQVRAIETMKIAMSLNTTAKALEIHKEEKIKERCYGELQGKSKLEMYLEDPHFLEQYRRSYTRRAVGGESLEDVVKRVTQFCDEIIPLIKTHHVNVAISCHGNSMRGFRKYFEDLPVEEVCKMETPLAQDYASYTIE